MALIVCPECKKEVSSTCDTCIHCGYDLTKHKIVKCPHCGSEVRKRAFCTSCGYSFNDKKQPIKESNVVKKHYVLTCILLFVSYFIVTGMISGIFESSNPSTMTVGIIGLGIVGIGYFIYILKIKYANEMLVSLIVGAIGLALGFIFYLNVNDVKFGDMSTPSCDDKGTFVSRVQSEIQSNTKNNIKITIDGCYSSVINGNVRVTCEYSEAQSYYNGTTGPIKQYTMTRQYKCKY